jgi:hypothetical protein
MGADAGVVKGGGRREELEEAGCRAGGCVVRSVVVFS